MEDRWLSVDEIAEYIGISRDTIYSWLREGKVPGHRAGHLWKFKRAEVDEWMRAGGAANSSRGQGESAGTSRNTQPVKEQETSNVNL